MMALPTEDTVDSEGNVWFSTTLQNELNKLDPVSGNITKVTYSGTLVVEPVSVPPCVDVAVNYGPGDAIWSTEVAANRVGRYQLS